MRRFAVLAAAALAVVAKTGGARAQTVIDRIALADIAQFLKEAGAETALGQTGAGGPLVEARAAGLNFQVLGFQCEGNGFQVPCAYIAFRVGIPDAPFAPATEFANQYDERNAYGRAFVDNRGVLICDYGVDLDGGVSRAHVRKLTMFWAEKVMPDFIASAVDFLAPYLEPTEAERP